METCSSLYHKRFNRITTFCNPQIVELSHKPMGCSGRITKKSITDLRHAAPSYPGPKSCRKRSHEPAHWSPANVVIVLTGQNACVTLQDEPYHLTPLSLPLTVGCVCVCVFNDPNAFCGSAMSDQFTRSETREGKYENKQCLFWQRSAVITACVLNYHRQST